MKIAYLLQEGAPDVRERPLKGPSNHVWQVFKELQKLGHQVTMLAKLDGQILISENLERFHPVTTRLDQGVLRVVERVVRGIQSRLKLTYINYFESERFAMACQQELAGYDVFLERMGWMGYGAGLAARRMKIPLVLEVNNGDFITELERLGVAPQGFQRRVAIGLMRRAAHRASRIVATGDGHRQRFIEWYRYDAAKVTVVENGSEITALLSRDQLPVFGDDGDTDGAVTIIFVGAFEPWHGILNLIPAMADVKKIVPNTNLILIGSGTEWDNIKQLLGEYNLGNCVEMTGLLPIEQVATQLAAADIGVAPYCGWMEFSGLKLFDYKSAGLAIVASGQDGQPTTLAHGRTALIVPPCDINALSEAIIQLAKDSTLRRSMGRAARLEAEKMHTWTHTARQLELILEGGRRNDSTTWIG